MTDPTERPDDGSINEATQRAVQADRARVIAAEAAAQRRRGSIRGRVERIWRWLRNRQSGPLPRIRRVGGVVRATVRGGSPWRSLPEAFATALLAPVRLPGKPPPPAPPRDRAPERAVARARLGAFAAGWSGTRSRVALIADAAALDRYQDAWDVVAVRPEDWAIALEAAPPDLVVVDSARDGNAGAWTYRIAWSAHPDWFLLRDLRALVEWAASRGIPSVFRMRDPADRVGDWADAARLFDLVLTADTATEAAFGSLPDRRGVVGRVAGATDDPASIVAAMRASS